MATATAADRSVAALDRMRADQAIAEWRCAHALMTEHGAGAEAWIAAQVGHGLNANEAEFLTSLVVVLRGEEQQDGPSVWD